MFVKEIGTEGQEEDEEEEEDAYAKSEPKARAQQKMNKSETRRTENINVVDQVEPTYQYDNASRQQKEPSPVQPVTSSNITAARTAAAQAAGPGSVDADAVLKAMGQHAIQQHLLNGLNIQQRQ